MSILLNVTRQRRVSGLNKSEVVYRLAPLLKYCDKSIERVEYKLGRNGAEMVIVHYISGAQLLIDITADSDFAVIRDIVSALM